MLVAARERWVERAVQPAIAATILFAVLASGSLQSWVPLARRLRWVALVGLVVVALAWAWQSGHIRPVRWAYVAASGFVACALISALWSADPRTTLGRASAFGLLLLAAAAVAWAAAGRPAAAERVLDGIVAGAALVVAGGLLVLIFRYERALAPATTSTPARYQGLGGGPNTASMLLAVALPAATHLALDGGLLRRRAFGFVVAIGILASIAASGSRGALLSAGMGLLVYAVLREARLRRSLLAGGLIVAVLALAAGAATIPDKAPPGTVSPEVAADPNPPPVEAVPPYVDANLILRLQDDAGHPPPGVGATNDPGRTLTGSSGRDDAWLGALAQADDRPLLGYGFGTEDKVFVDRYAGFNSAVPENSYIGLSLQLGFLGLVAFAGLVASLLVPAVRSRSRRLSIDRRRLVATSAGMLAAGLVLGLFQSFVYAPGNNATAALWIGAFLLVALQPAPSDTPI